MILGSPDNLAATTLDNARVLAIIQTQLPQLLAEAEALLPPLDPQSGSAI